MARHITGLKIGYFYDNHLTDSEFLQKEKIK